MNVLFLTLAFVAGAAIATQAAVNSQLAAGLGGFPITAAFLSFVVGTIALGMIAAFTGSLGAPLSQIGGQPLWRYAGGLLGAGAIFCTVLLAPRLGLTTLLALVISGQLLTSIAIDHFGLLGVVSRPATPVRLVRGAIMLAGVLLALFGDRVLSARPVS